MSDYPPSTVKLATVTYLREGWYVVLNGHLRAERYDTKPEAQRNANRLRRIFCPPKGGRA